MGGWRRGGGRGCRPKSPLHLTSAMGEKGTGVLLGSVASGDKRHPERAMAPLYRFSGFPRAGKPGGVGTKIRWGYPQVAEGVWCP